MQRKEERVKVCLIGPPTVTDLEDRYLVESEAVRIIAEHAPIGILTLAAVLEQHGLSPQVVDLNSTYYEYLRSDRKDSDFCTFAIEKIASSASTVFGFGTICSTYPLTLRIAREIARSVPDARIVLGGPQASVVDVQTLEAFEFIDFIVRGEAEETFPALLNALSQEVRWDGIPGLTFRRDGEVVRNPNGPVILNLDSIPTPAFHLFPDMKSCRFIPLELGRGCPFACKFCSTNDFFRRRFRLKSPQRVIEQMRWAKQAYGIGRFELIHDMFTVDRKRVVDFCQAVLASAEGFEWNCSARTDCVDEELIALMARAGCRSIFFGIETGSSRLQKEIDKNLDLNEAALRIRSTTQHRIATTVSLITGFPDETREDLRSTVHFLMDALRLDYAEPHLHLLAPLAETPIHSQYRDRLVLDDVFSDMAYQGWRQNPAEREMIASHPAIFPNFYGVPTTWLDRAYIKELRDFILSGIQRFRWLLVALHQDSGDLLRVFEEWKAWCRQVLQREFVSDSESSLYYSRIEFREDFLRFVRSDYVPRIAKATTALSALLKCESAHRMLADCAIPVRTNASKAPTVACVLDRDAIPMRSDGVRVLELGADYKEIIECLRKEGDLGRVPACQVVVAIRPFSERRSDVLQLSPLSAELLRLCDGNRCVSDIARYFSHPDGDEGDVVPEEAVPEEACVYGLGNLHRHGLIVFEARHSQATAWFTDTRDAAD